MFRPVVSLFALLSVSALLVGCASDAAGTGPTASPSTTAAPSPTPAPADQIALITLDGASVDGGSLIDYDDSDAIIAAFTELLGASPAEAPVEGPYGAVYDGYEWDSVRAVVQDTWTDVTVTADAPGVTFTTEEGIGIGSTRAEAIAAGAEDGWDEDGDGVADHLNLGTREVPGTQSLVNPGEVGVEYILLTVEDDVVTVIRNGGNDFSDI